MRTTAFTLVLVAASITAAPLASQSSTPAIPSPALLVAEKRGGQLAVTDPATLKVVAHVPAAPTPHEVATDGRFAYLSTQGGALITTIDLTTLRPVEGIDTGAIGQVHGLMVHDGKLYFTSERARTVARYDPNTRKIDWLFGGGQGRTHLVRISSDGSKIFTTNIGSGTLSIIERVEPAAGRGGGGGGAGGGGRAAGASGGGRAGGAVAAPSAPDWTITAVQAGEGAEGIAVSPDEKTIWTANVPAKSLSVIDVATKKLVATIPVTTTYTNRVAFTRDGKFVVATDLRGNELTVFDAITHKELQRIPIGGGTEGILVGPDGRIFVSCTTLNKVAIIDPQSFKVAGEIPGLDGPDGMVWLAR